MSSKRYKHKTYIPGVSLKPKCKASWCKLEGVYANSFCRYHWRYLPTHIRNSVNFNQYSVKRNLEFEASTATALNYLIKSHIELVTCKKCLTRPVKNCYFCKGTKLVPKIN